MFGALKITFFVVIMIAMVVINTGGTYSHNDSFFKSRTNPPPVGSEPPIGSKCQLSCHHRAKDSRLSGDRLGRSYAKR